MGIVSYIKDLFGLKQCNDSTVVDTVPIVQSDKAPITFAERMAEIDKAFADVFKNTEVVSLPDYDTIVERGPSTRILSDKQRAFSIPDQDEIDEILTIDEYEEIEEMKRKKFEFPTVAEWFLNQDYKYKPSAAEKLIITELSKYTLPFYTEISFKGLVSDKGGLLRFDFYIPSINTIIEYDGAKYHNTHDVRIRDNRKTDFCKYHKIKLIRLNKEHYYNIPKYIKQIITGTFK